MDDEGVFFQSLQYRVREFRHAKGLVDDAEQNLAEWFQSQRRVKELEDEQARLADALEVERSTLELLRHKHEVTVKKMPNLRKDMQGARNALAECQWIVNEKTRELIESSGIEGFPRDTAAVVPPESGKARRGSGNSWGGKHHKRVFRRDSLLQQRKKKRARLEPEVYKQLREEVAGRRKTGRLSEEEECLLYTKVDELVKQNEEGNKQSTFGKVEEAD